MKKTLCYLLMMTFFLYSCSDKSETKEHKYLTEIIEKMEINPKYEYIIILPGLGCHGCIQEAEYFMKKHINDNRIMYVLTNTSSIKILEQKTELRFQDHSNVFIDNKKLYQLPTENGIYPCVIEMDTGTIIKHSFQSPRTAALYDLEKKL